MNESLYGIFLNSTGISTDTRKVEKNNLFFALKGDNFNGNAYADAALERGAVAVVIDEPHYKKDDRYLVVENGLKALQELATSHRRQMNIPIVAITGSNGKTTTKELMHHVLSTKLNVVATVGNLNNHIGVPLTLLSIKESTELAIIEMGANHVGDIAELCAIAEPTHGLITNIGRAHLGEFGGFENIIRTKSELYHYLIQNRGVIWVNQLDEVLMNMSKRMKNPLYYPHKDSFAPCTLLSANPYVRFESFEGREVETHILGAYNFLNIATALAVGKYFEVDHLAACQAIASYKSDNNRSQVLEKSGLKVVLDAYNANPSSMEAAIRNIDSMEAEHKVLVLGDMFELGSESAKEHQAIGSLVGSMQLDEAILIGPDFQHAKKACPNGQFFKEKETAVEYLQNLTLEPGTLVLIKGSRGMALESLLAYL